MVPVVKALIVTDGSGGFLPWTSKSQDHSFHLGEFVSVLQATSWLGFNLEITRAHRQAPGGGVTEAQLKAQTGADVVGFRFDQGFTAGGQPRTLSDYDMVLFFSIVTYDSSPTLQAQADAIARFMEAGGGFFAVGDHENLGAPLCRLIPRVRSMRRWYYNGPEGNPAPGPNGEPPAPSGLGSDRHDTLVTGADAKFDFEDQSDEFPQTITPVWYFGGVTSQFGYPGWVSYPHPLLCSPDGAVTYLPDHMHEGWCEVPDHLGARTFTLDGNTVREYPDLSGQPLKPEVVATGHISGGHTTLALDPTDHPNATALTAGGDFGVIGAWDGHRVGKGRVVVDSTWHHFFNINLTGDHFLDGLVPPDNQRLHGFYVLDPATMTRVPNGPYRMIQWYYRNIIYWLIPADRWNIIWWFALARIALTPRLREELTLPQAARQLRTLDDKINPLDLGRFLYWGQLADRYFRLARGACGLAHIWVVLYKPKIPWWEWVQEVADPWAPAEAGAAQREEALRLQWLAGVGAGPDPAALMRAGLGIAVAMAAQGSAQGELDEKQARALHEAWPRALDNLGQVFAEQIRTAGEVSRRFSLTLEGPRAG